MIRRHQERLRAEYEKMLRVDRDNTILWARDVLSDPSAVIILDTETTGLDPSAEIVQISLITIDGASLFDSLVRPTQPIPPEATAIHHIADLDVAQAPSFDMIYGRLKALLEGKRVVIYNAGFDIQMPRQSGRHYHLPALTIKKPCAMEMYAQFVGDWSDYFMIPDGSRSLAAIIRR